MAISMGQGPAVFRCCPHSIAASLRHTAWKGERNALFGLISWGLSRLLLSTTTSGRTVRDW